MRLPLSRVRWDRKLRTAMLVVLMLVGWIGVQGILNLLATHAQAEQQLSLVQSLARANRALEAQERQLSQPATIVRDARALGMVRSNEQAYVITGLPSGH
jgi:cell division protein FtsB